MTILETVNALNEGKFNAFSAKPDATRKSPNLSLVGEDGKRYWLNRRNVGTKEAPKYEWAIGNPMRE